MAVIGFDFKPSAACLVLENMELVWLHRMDDEHEFFQQLSRVDAFDYFFIDNILVIPDPVPVAREKWNRKIGISNLELECEGKFIVFLNFRKVKKGFIFADSLKLPQFQFLKGNIRWI
ncbi:hypothetical protein [Sporolactobacillus terrae]|uniref:Uncharacterized protein n=1 Tax=Sporolactobacillus terrae TaxID=269673 RepID=A0ABX5QA28_9BACL|nr:hypothetical protein [Sporolactobacillus terrae]QAA23526.1 hypothetical protein C0674_13465 [Sporolactobacillus terrae]QAA26496.1 hypothetical protein C0679_13450 [Sporolactobacillus terrae]